MIRNPDFTLSVEPNPVEVTGKYDKSKKITTIEIKGLGLYLTLDLPGDHTKDVAPKRVKEAVLRLSNNGRLHLSRTHLWPVIQQLP